MRETSSQADAKSPPGPCPPDPASGFHTSEEKNPVSLSQQNITVLSQAEQLLSTLDPDQYGPPGDGSSGIGAHLRHCLDAYRCFLGGWRDGRVDYDARERDPRLENEVAAGRDAVAAVKASLAEVPADAADAEVRVRHDAAAYDDPESWSRSTVAREMQFLLSHTIHHYALIAFTLRSRGIDVDPAFGVAPSTLEHRERSARAVCAQ